MLRMVNRMTGTIVDEIISRESKAGANKSVWINNIENILVALEMYRREEEKAVVRLANILKINGVDVSEETIRNSNTQEIKEIIENNDKKREAI